jgi:hypothetical protein
MTVRDFMPNSPDAACTVTKVWYLKDLPDPDWVYIGGEYNAPPPLKVNTFGWSFQNGTILVAGERELC